MHEAAHASAPLLFAGLAALFLGFGLAGVTGWLSQRPWGIGLTTVALAFAPLVWFLSKAGGGAHGADASHSAAGGHAAGPSISGDETVFLVSLLVGLLLGLLMLRSSERTYNRTFGEPAQPAPATTPHATAHTTAHAPAATTTVVTTAH